MIIGIEERGSLMPVQARRKTGKENGPQRERESARTRRIYTVLAGNYTCANTVRCFPCDRARQPAV